MTRPMVREYGAESVPTLTGLRARKHATRARVGVIVAGESGASTVTAIRAAIERDLIDGAGLVDEICVSDPAGIGRGAALRNGLRQTNASIVLLLDGGIRNFSPRIAVRMLSPLLLEETLSFVKGFTTRISPKGGGRAADHGAARPLLAASFPELDAFVQPFSREVAARATLLRSLSFPRGEGIDAGLLIGAFEIAGLDTMGQADLGGSLHRTAPVAHYDGDIALTVLRRAEERGRMRPFADASVYPLLVRDTISGLPELPPLGRGHVIRSRRPPRLVRTAT